jgi:hypothetical protein
MPEHIELMEGSPGNKINLAKELTGKGLIIGVPAAFSTFGAFFFLNTFCLRRSCSATPEVGRLPANYFLFACPWVVFLSPLCVIRAFYCTTRLTLSSSLLINPGPTCSASHIPGYINSPKLKNAGQVFVVSVNDPFV